MLRYKRTLFLLLALWAVVICVLPLIAISGEAATTLTCWYSGGSKIGHWTYSPQIYYYSSAKVDGDIPINAGIGNARSAWNNALGTSITISTTSYSAPIEFGAVTIDQCPYVGANLDPADDAYGVTVPTKYVETTSTYNDSTKTIYRMTAAECYVLYNESMSYTNYIKTITHEVGHAMGWLDHPASYQSTWIMQQGRLTNTTVKTNEANHLAQLY